MKVGEEDGSGSEPGCLTHWSVKVKRKSKNKSESESGWHKLAWLIVMVSLANWHTDLPQNPAQAESAEVKAKKWKVKVKVKVGDQDGLAAWHTDLRPPDRLRHYSVWNSDSECCWSEILNVYFIFTISMTNLISIYAYILYTLYSSCITLSAKHCFVLLETLRQSVWFAKFCPHPDSTSFSGVEINFLLRIIFAPVPQGLDG